VAYAFSTDTKIDDFGYLLYRSNSLGILRDFADLGANNG